LADSKEIVKRLKGKEGTLHDSTRSPLAAFKAIDVNAIIQ
jgi:hypothetical protein